uniref:RAB20, member RAS oncogene family n=1 Tax=Anolis carolinensis TaxID=28377 RepID=G1KPF0_ANOCA
MGPREGGAGGRAPRAARRLGSFAMKPDGKVVLLGDMNVGKTSLLHRYMERRFQETVSTVGGAFYLKQWGAHNISVWDTAGEPPRFHGLGSMYCRGAAAVILTYDVTNLQSMMELEDRFLALTDTASTDCIFAIVGNKVDLTDTCAFLHETEDNNPSEKPNNGLILEQGLILKQIIHTWCVFLLSDDLHVHFLYLK